MLLLPLPLAPDGSALPIVSTMPPEEAGAQRVRGRRSVGPVNGRNELAELMTYGPLQSKGMCLLDLPSHSHLNPKPSTRSAVALPQVATCPGPTSLPGGLSSCTRCPSGVVGPVRASALATTLSGISALQ